jgi:hypothetical protein
MIIHIVIDIVKMKMKIIIKISPKQKGKLNRIPWITIASSVKSRAIKIKKRKTHLKPIFSNISIDKSSLQIGEFKSVINVR